MPSRRYDTSVTLQIKPTRLALELPLNAKDLRRVCLIPCSAKSQLRTVLCADFGVLDLPDTLVLSMRCVEIHVSCTLSRI